MPRIRTAIATLAVAALAASATAGTASAQVRHHHPRHHHHHHHAVCLQPGGPIFPGHVAVPLRCVTIKIPVA